MSTTEPTSPANTAKQDPLLTFAESMSNPNFIEDQESRGQAELVNSTSLPTNPGRRGDRAAYEALGFVFGDPIPGDEMFTAMTLPPGWKKQATDHAMWSSVVDELGRERVAVFYKAAFYDRSAHMTLASVENYLSSCLYYERTPVLDDVWATRPAVAEVLEEIAKQFEERSAEWARMEPGSEYIEDYRAKAAAARAAIVALGEASA